MVWIMHLHVFLYKLKYKQDMPHSPTLIFNISVLV